MVETISQVEAVPEAYPTPEPEVWQRIELHCAHRWTARAVVWVVEGVGHWVAPLTPAAVTSVERWQDGAWQAIDNPPATPAGGLELNGTYRITATVGADNSAPAMVLQAAERLKNYVEADAGGAVGARAYSVNVGQMSESIRRDPAFMAQALHNSGAADLLRGFRRV